MKSFKQFLEAKEKWMQKAKKDIEERGTEGICSGKNFGGPRCKPGTRRYALAKTFKKAAKKHKKNK